MKYICFALFVIPLIGCATESFKLNVYDEEGRPISNAVVIVKSRNNTATAGRHHTDKKGDYTQYSADTDINGYAKVDFYCPCAFFDWYVVADGYYSSDWKRDVFKEEVSYDLSNATICTRLLEHEKTKSVKLFKKKNPQKMSAHEFDYSKWGKMAPWQNGRYGYDLELNDWLPPLGKGQIADFYYVRERKDPEEMDRLVKSNKMSEIFVSRANEKKYPVIGDVVGRIEFEPRCGAYIKKQTGDKNFPSVYHADTNENFLSSFPVVWDKGGPHSIFVEQRPLLQKDDYMIIRSRVKLDDEGNIVSEHYSKIVGFFTIGEQIAIECIVFNPRPNDVNLEHDFGGAYTK